MFTSLNSINPSGNISIPLGVGIYNTLLRMRVMTENSGAIQGPCSPPIKGQVEDYAVTILQFVGVHEVEAKIKVEVYPNPSSGLFTIQASEKISRIEILNILGEKVYSSANITPLTTWRIDLGKQPKGVYFYKALLENGLIRAGKLMTE